MSPHNGSSIEWSPDRLRFGKADLAKSLNTARTGRRAPPIKDKFIKGPIYVSWVCHASKLGRTALLVGLALWYLKGLRQTDIFVVSNLMLREWGVLPDAKQRALHKLETAGLIKVNRRGKRSPEVTLIVGKTFIGGETTVTDNQTI